MQVTMVDIKELKDYDIKNIDVSGLIKNLRQRPDIVLNFCIIFLTAITIVKIYGNQQSKEKDLSQKVVVLEEKVKAISKYESAKNELERFMEALPQGLPQTTSMVDKINSMAIDHNIQILSFVPLGKVDHPLYIRSNARVTIAAMRYEDLGFFINEIETSPYNLRIERCSTSSGPKDQYRRPSSNVLQLGDTVDRQINAEIEIAFIDFKK